MDIFDRIAEPKGADIFDRIGKSSGPDIFDKIMLQEFPDEMMPSHAPPKQVGVFDRAYDMFVKREQSLKEKLIATDKAKAERMGLPEETQVTAPKAKAVLSVMPWLTTEAIKGFMLPVLPALKSIGMDTEKALNTAIEYWKSNVGDVDIPDFSVSLSPFKIESKEASLKEIAGGTAGAAGMVAGPINVASRAAGLVAQQVAKSVRPFYQTILKGMVTGGLLGEGEEQKTIENMALFGVFEPLAYGASNIGNFINSIKASARWRKASIQDRGRLLESLDMVITRMKSEGANEAEILRYLRRTAPELATERFQKTQGIRPEEPPAEARPIIPEPPPRPPTTPGDIVMRPETPIAKAPKATVTTDVFDRISKALPEPEKPVEITDIEEFGAGETRITSTAIKMNDGTIYTGKNHGLALDKIPMDKRGQIADADGFVDSTGKFMTREEAVAALPEGLPGKKTADAADIVGKEITPATPSAPKAKEPWEMTQKEWADAYDRSNPATIKEPTPRQNTENIRLQYGAKSTSPSGLVFHKDVIQKALSEGKPVPPEVLKDYPDLKPEWKGEEPVAIVMPVRNDMAPSGTYIQSRMSPKWTDAKPPTQDTRPPSAGAGYADTGGYATNIKSVLQMPEIVNLAKELMGGKYPDVKKKLRKRNAAGVFYPGKGSIELKADLFQNPDQAAATLAHEIGHLVDWLPDKDLSRGNVLGRIATLKKYMRHTLPRTPGGKETLTPKDRDRIRNIAEKLARKDADKWIDEVIKKEFPVTPEDVLKIWNAVEDAKLINPDLYEFVARLNTAEKKAVVKEALKGVTHDSLKKFTKIIEEPTGKKIKIEPYIEVNGKKVKAEWFKEAINKKYAELINAELKKLRMFKLDEITKELRALSTTWKPFNPAENPKFTAYRFSGVELYADAFSAIINAPGLVKSLAPNFYEGFFNYIERKPEVKRLYEEIQNDIASGDFKPKRVKRLREMFKKGDDAYSKGLEKENRLKDGIARELIDVDIVLHRKIKKIGESNIPAGDNPRYKLEQMRYSGSEAEYYINTLYNKVLKPIEDAGLTWDDLGEYMYHRRVSSERAEMANPQGWTPATSQERIKEMKDALGDKFDALEDARNELVKLRQEAFIDKAEKSKMFSPELMDKIKNNENYATFDVVEYIEKEYGSGSGAKIYKQIGTLKDISNPATATAMKDISLVKAINRNDAAKSVAEFMKKYFPDEIKSAETKWNGKFWEIKKPSPKGPDGLVLYSENGKLKGYYVDKFISDIFDDNPYSNMAIGKLLNVTVKPFRMVFTELNYGFWMFNIIRDYNRAAKMLPKNKISTFLPYYLSSIKPAFKSVFGLTDKTISEMQKNNMLISIADVRGLSSEDRQIERLLAMYHVKPGKWEKGIRKPFGSMFYYFTNIGRGFERTTKVASYKYLKEKFPDLPDSVIGHIVRVRGGSPDFLRLGRAYPIYNNLLMFSNAMKEGYRGDYEAFRGNPAEFIWKQAKYTYIPKLLMKAGALGLLGVGVKQIYDGMSEYDKTNYITIPLGLTETGKSVYLRVPQDETSRFFGGVFWKLINMDEKQQFADLFDYMSGQAPTINPTIDIAGDVLSYAEGKNPYDSFRGRYAISEDIFLAGGKRSHEAFAKYISQKLGAGIVYKFKYDDVESIKSELEKVIGYPIASNIIGRFIRVSDRGVREEITDEKMKVRSENMRELLDAKDAIKKMLNGEKLDRFDIEALLNKPDIIDKNMMVGFARKYNFLYLDEYIKAQSNKEKAIVIKKMLENERVNK